MTQVVNIHQGTCDVYIGRGSPFGNPYVIGQDGDRQEVIRLYRIYFYEKIKRDPEFRVQVEALRGKKLGCHCSPMPCHGDVIVEYLNRINAPFHFYIDVVGACSVRCPCCPVGNMSEVPYAKDIMHPELLDRIMAKAKVECDVSGVGLFNWTEPVLHPNLAEMIRVVHSHGVPVQLSANLNFAKNLKAVLLENPEFLRVTVSGFTQETYGITHAGGRIERVKANMEELSKLRRELGARTHVQVTYLKYLTNLHEEDQMREFVHSLGFEWSPMWALLFPMEKVLGHRGVPGYVAPSPEDRKLIGNLALPLDEALDAAQRRKNGGCTLLENQVTMDSKGDVQLCCAVYDPSKFTIANFLDTPLRKLQELRHSPERRKTCLDCMGLAVHDYYCFQVPGIDEIAQENIARKMLETTPS